MTLRAMIFSIAAGLLGAPAAVATPAIAAAPDGPQPPLCRKPEYPPESVRLGEAGVTMIGFLVRSDGAVDRSVILNSTGSGSLDRAAVDTLSKCRFRPAVKDGQPSESWAVVAYRWSLQDDPAMARVKREVALAAKAGSADAWYHLSLLLSMTAETDADRQRAATLLKSAAERGHPHAQFQMGSRYEKGDGVEADAGEAMRWYEKAAAQGDVFAIERLKGG